MKIANLIDLAIVALTALIVLAAVALAFQPGPSACGGASELTIEDLLSRK